ncbi:LysR family transcriptional regulator [Turicibacter sanguinis]|uniref:LysR family transcriptional regulator n=1 Tax=Turicibacter sanguinis TaxID=154288 RepID=UPI00232D45EB|nr:LysR family transcriptional regulator [Turicibacter sanguinis]MDB8437859.1 LysR family transcriptional regulator [Turicibacter sanguinis]
MIDYRLLTFIDVCETRNLTKTAKHLCLTQPAVTQHIKYLEETYNTKLFVYEGKKMQITESAYALLQYALKTQALLKSAEAEIYELKTKQVKLNFGATLTIADYVMPTILDAHLKRFPDIQLNFKVQNTSHLIEDLLKGKIEFAFIEGYFDKEQFEHHLLKKDDFILVTSINSALNETITLEELKKQRLIIREFGSGSRDILEKLLANTNSSLNQFRQLDEIGSLKLLKHLVKQNHGVTFIYKEAVKEELERNELKQIQIDGINLSREFNFVYLKSFLHKEKYQKFFRFAKDKLTDIDLSIGEG